MFWDILELRPQNLNENFESSLNNMVSDSWKSGFKMALKTLNQIFQKSTTNKT